MKKHNKKKSLRSYEQNAAKTFQKTTSNSVKVKKKTIAGEKPNNIYNKSKRKKYFTQYFVLL